MMMRTNLVKTTALGVVAAFAMLAAPAAATTIYTIDDFNSAVSTITKTGNVVTAATTPQHDPFTATLDNVGSKIVASTPNFYTIGGYDFKRDLTFDITQDPSSLIGQKASITLLAATGSTPAKLTTSTGSMVATHLSLSYDITSLASMMIPGSDATFTVLMSDGTGTPGSTNPLLQPTTITATLDGAAAGVSQALNVAYGGTSGNGTKTLYFTLPMSMIGGIDRLIFDFTGPAGYDLSISSIGVAIPEPGVVGLFGLGAASLLFARRRKR